MNETKTTSTKNTIPWIEKYRPHHFDEIVLDPINRRLFQNIIEKNTFPNLLFYGPPGSGKTSTIINLIQEYQKKHNIHNHFINKGNIIHLNASDERGIDIIRNQIYQFVSTKNIFDNGIKFVVLDEVDYMTKNAQQALKYLLQTTVTNVRFCLICNYVSKIDESLQNEFICIRFNQLPKQEIFKFIKTISIHENIELSDSMIEKIQSMYHSDIRSMINFIQSNHSLIEQSMFDCIVHDELWETIHETFTKRSVKQGVKRSDDKRSDEKRSVNESNEQNDTIVLLPHDCIQKISTQYNIDKKQIIQNYFNYIIRNHSISREFLRIAEMIVHNSENIPTPILTDCFVLYLTDYWNTK